MFDQGNDFAKITHKVGAKYAETMIAEFRNAYNPRIAVTVDMIGTDVKAIEALIFLRDVRSAVYFEQMRGRGARTIDPVTLAVITPGAGVKDRFVPIHVVGVTDSLKAPAIPLEREHGVAFDKLLEQIASRSDEDAVATLSGRLDRKLDDEAKAKIEAVAGKSLSSLAGELIDAIDADKIEGDAVSATVRRSPMRRSRRSPPIDAKRRCPRITTRRCADRAEEDVQGRHRRDQP